MKSTFDLFCFKRIVFTIVIISSVHFSFAQDIIETKSGVKIKAKVVDIGPIEIKYKSYDNLTGPMQTLDKQYIIAITFANGTIKRFTELPKPIDKMVQPEKFRTGNNDKSVLWEYQFDTNNIFSGTTIYYYGLDMSHLVLINADKVNQEQSLRHYLPSWHQKFDEVITIDLIKRGLQTTKVVLKNENVQFTHELVITDWIKDGWNGLSIEEVIIIVDEFCNTIEEKEGVGFLFILDNYNKPKNKVRAICTFFDLASGEVLWASKVEGDAGDKDMVKHWGFGMVRMYHNFRLAVYETEYKNYRKGKYSN